MMAHDSVARLVVHLARRALDRLKHDVLVETGRHPRREHEPRRIVRIESLARGSVLPRDDLVEAFDTDDPQSSRELVHTEVEPVDSVVRLAVIAERPRELDQIVVSGDEHPAFTGGDRLRRRERPDTRIAPRSRAATVP